MTERRKLEQQASSFTRKINNFLYKNTNLKIHGIARQGSRRQGTHRDESDLDIVFALAQDLKKNQIYPELAEKLRKEMNVEAKIGKNNNVINIKAGGLDVDLVLLPKEQFEKQLKENKIKRIESK